MYSIQDPIGSQPLSGGAIQILGIQDQYICRSLPNTKTFFASLQDLVVNHWQNNQEGYSFTPTHHQGNIYDPVRQKKCQWQYEIQPVYLWGDSQRPPKATAGFLSYLPIFDPGWQILIAHGLASGYIDWWGNRYEFDKVPLYAEKNWGYSFPQKWFWINCNYFPEQPDLTITAVGSTRKLFHITESVGLIGVHHEGKFYEFGFNNSQLSWYVTPWGYWEMRGENELYSIHIIGTTDRSPSLVRVPTDKGLCFRCRDTKSGYLSVELRNNKFTIVKTFSQLAGLEIGGDWATSWQK
jgi:tocopherol cyclase